jgi:hypothetical protein
MNAALSMGFMKPSQNLKPDTASDTHFSVPKKMRPISDKFSQKK